MTTASAKTISPPLEPVLDNIPDELKASKQWVNWKYEATPGGSKPKKPPYDPGSGRKIDPTDPAKWHQFDDATGAISNFDGIGFVFSKDDPYCGIDLDNCRDPSTGQIEEWARKIIKAANSYTEVSPSGCGVKIFCKGKNPASKGRKAPIPKDWGDSGEVEIYDQQRYFTVTGQKLPDASATINEAQIAIDDLYRKVFIKQDEQKPKLEIVKPSLGGLSLLDKAALEAAKAKNERLAKLWSGDWEGLGYQSQSDADFALCGDLIRIFGRDPATVDRAFRESGLFRPKWDQMHGAQTYGTETIAKVLDGDASIGLNPQIGIPSQETKSSCFKIDDVNQYSSGRFLKEEPQPLSWLLKDSLPLGQFGLVVSNGGLGKSFLLLQLGYAVGGLLPFLNGLYDVSRGKVFMVFGEDNDAVIHHRLYRIAEETNKRIPLKVKGTIKHIHEVVGRNLFTKSICGEDARLMRPEGRSYAPTQAFHDLLEALKSIDDLKLVVLDPLSRFFSGDENDSTAANFFCTLMERIATETGASVIVSQHTNKAAAAANGAGRKGDLVQEAIRGSSAFTNAARWQLNLAPLRDRDCKALDVGEEERHLYLEAKVTKKNFGPPERSFYMKRGEHGILKRVISSTSADEKKEILEKVMGIIADEEAKGKRFTKRAFLESHSKRWNGYGPAKLAKLLDQAIKEGQLVVVTGKNVRGREVAYLSAKTTP